MFVPSIHGCNIKNWIQRCWQAPIHSYESCSVVHEAKNGWIRDCSAVLPVLCVHRASALETLLLLWCVTSVEPATSSLVRR